jgi:hypothetical protein
MARQMKMVVNKILMKDHDQASQDLQYWLSKTPQERLAAVTFLINQNIEKGQRMDKTKFSQKRLKP